MVTENIEGRERYPVNVRYNRDFRDNVEALRRVLIATPSGAQIPIDEVAQDFFLARPCNDPRRRRRAHRLRLHRPQYQGLRRIRQACGQCSCAKSSHLPAGYTYKWSGEYEFEQRAKERLEFILPVVFFVIFLLLYMVFHSVTEAAVLIFPTIYALTGGLILQRLLGYNFSVAVWVGYIALFGIAVETGVVMVVYLHEALNRRLASGAAAQARGY